MSLQNGSNSRILWYFVLLAPALLIGAVVIIQPLWKVEGAYQGGEVGSEASKGTPLAINSPLPISSEQSPNPPVQDVPVTPETTAVQPQEAPQPVIAQSAENLPDSNQKSKQPDTLRAAQLAQEFPSQNVPVAQETTAVQLQASSRLAEKEPTKKPPASQKNNLGGRTPLQQPDAVPATHLVGAIESKNVPPNSTIAAVTPLNAAVTKIRSTETIIPNSKAVVLNSSTSPTATPEKSLQELRAEQFPTGGAARLTVVKLGTGETAIKSTLRPCTPALQLESNCLTPALIAQATAPVEPVESPPPAPIQPTENKSAISQGSKVVGGTPLPQPDSVIPTHDMSMPEYKTRLATTTKINGEVIIGISQVFGDKKAVPSGSTPKDNLDRNTILGDRIRISFDTENLLKDGDQLRVRLQAGNIPNFQNATGTNMARLAYDVSGGDNSFVLERLRYKFPVTDKLTMFFEGKGGDTETISPPISSFVDKYNEQDGTPTGTVSSGTGPISRFARFSPIYRIDSGTAAGLLLNYKFNKKLNGSVGYFAANANDPSPKSGFLNGGYGAIAQLDFQPLNQLELGLTYAHTYGNSPTGNTGSTFATNPFGSLSVTTSNSFGIESNFKVNKDLIVSGWVDYTNAVSEVTKKKATLLNWALSLAFPNLGKHNAVAGILVGQPPKVTANDDSNRTDKGTSWHIEGFYRYPVTEHLDITPGFFVILNPENNNANGPIYVGAIRTRLSF